MNPARLLLGRSPMNAIRATTKRTLLTFADAKRSLLRRVSRALRGLEGLRMAPAELGQVTRASQSGPSEADVFAPKGRARLTVDCTLAGDRCHDPSRAFAEMERAGSPLEALRSTLEQLRPGRALRSPPS